MTLDDAINNRELILEVIHIIRDYCPNKNEGNLCKKHSGCLECWESELKK